MKGLILSLGLAAAISNSTAAQQSPLMQIRQRYESCVQRLAPAFAKQGAPKEMAVEQAFGGCATEEQAMVAALRIAFPSLDPATVAASWRRVKLRLKQSIAASLP